MVTLTNKSYIVPGVFMLDGALAEFTPQHDSNFCMLRTAIRCPARRPWYKLKCSAMQACAAKLCSVAWLRAAERMDSTNVSSSTVVPENTQISLPAGRHVKVWLHIRATHKYQFHSCYRIACPSTSNHMLLQQHRIALFRCPGLLQL
jgi:hypothetical protein